MKKENNLTMIIKMYIFACAIVMSTARATSVLLSRCRNNFKIISACIFYGLFAAEPTLTSHMIMLLSNIIMIQEEYIRGCLKYSNAAAHSVESDTFYAIGDSRDCREMTYYSLKLRCHYYRARFTNFQSRSCKSQALFTSFNR